MSSSECIKVMVRVRPLNKDELNRKNISIINVNQEKGEISIYQPGNYFIQKIKNFVNNSHSIVFLTLMKNNKLCMNKVLLIWLIKWLRVTMVPFLPMARL